MLSRTQVVVQAIVQVLEVVLLGQVDRGGFRAREAAAPVVALGEDVALWELREL